ncbi:MAG: hypothetical protein JWO52_6914 [Gammaproteobacteria bacterium]|jgi:hypothetical protein|nr:hypothetical protein [Gammaproteobacteria bacterium]
MNESQTTLHDFGLSVMQRASAEKLYTQLDSLSDIIEQLGGRTEITDCRDQSRSIAKREAAHVGA